MHELSLAQALVQQVAAIVEREQASRVAALTVSIGALAGVDRDAFEFAYPYAAEDTVLAGAELHVRECPADVLCSTCGRHSSPEVVWLRCVHCGSADIEVVCGRDFLLESVELE